MKIKIKSVVLKGGFDNGKSLRNECFGKGKCIIYVLEWNVFLKF